VQNEALQDCETTATAEASIVEGASLAEADPAVSPPFAPEIEPVIDAVAMPRKNLLQRMRDWLRRAA
jgi:8-oxo-dGTP diphosphatase